MLAEHRVDDANESFITVEQTVPSGEKISFQPALALVLAEHRIQHAAGGREKFIITHFARIPLPVGDVKHSAEEIRDGLIGTKDTEITLILIHLGDIAQEQTQHLRILGADRTG